MPQESTLQYERTVSYIGSTKNTRSMNTLYYKRIINVHLKGSKLPSLPLVDFSIPENPPRMIYPLSLQTYFTKFCHFSRPFSSICEKSMRAKVSVSRLLIIHLESCKQKTCALVNSPEYINNIYNKHRLTHLTGLKVAREQCDER